MGAYTTALSSIVIVPSPASISACTPPRSILLLAQDARQLELREHAGEAVDGRLAVREHALHAVAFKEFQEADRGLSGYKAAMDGR